MKRVFAFAFVTALLCGCGRNPQGPKAYDIAFDLSLSATAGDPAHPVSARFRGTNQGARPVFIFYQGCTTANPDLRVLGPDGSVVFLSDPTNPPMCPTSSGEFIPFGPGAVAEGAIEFTGKLYMANGVPYDAPAGSYTAVTNFVYFRTQTAGREQVERSARFNWTP